MDYRSSHQGKNKGEIYNKKFFEKNYQNLIYKWEEKVLKKLVNNIPEANYLDFACGTGRITRVIAPHVKDTTGMDISEEMLKTARKEVENVSFLLGDATRGDFDQVDSYDLITSFRFFTNAQPELRQSALNWITEKSKPGGLFIFNIHMNSSSLYALMARLFEVFNGKRKGFNHLSMRDFSKMGLYENFEVIEIYGKSILPVFREQKKRSTILLKLLNTIEGFFSSLPGFYKVSKYQIVVCQRKK